MLMEQSVESKTVKSDFHFKSVKEFHETSKWACNNLFLIDGKDTCPEKKVFGIRASDIPQGHELRKIYPNKFK